MSTLYENDVVAWSKRQADLLRSGNFPELDVENIAEEIEGVGRGELREFAGRLSILLAYLLKWQCQPSGRSNSWQATIQTQRRIIQRRIEKTRSVALLLRDESFLADAFDDAIALAVKETDMPPSEFPQKLLWRIEKILNVDLLPDAASIDSDFEKAKERVRSRDHATLAILEQYSRGELQRSFAVKQLDLRYYTQLLDLLGVAQLPLPTVSDDLTNKMLDDLFSALNEKPEDE